MATIISANLLSGAKAETEFSCTKGELVAAGAIAVSCLASGAAILYGGYRFYPVAKKTVMEWASNAYQSRYDIASKFLYWVGGGLMATSGLSYPNVTMGIGLATIAADIALRRYSPPMHSLDSAQCKPLIIDEHSPHHLDYPDPQYVGFTLPRLKVCCTSVGAALEISKTSLEFRRLHRCKEGMENCSAPEVRAYLASHLRSAYIVPEFDLGGVAQELLEQKYGVDDESLKNGMTIEQIHRRAALLKTMGDDPEHPREIQHSAMAGLTEKQLSGWLMRIRSKIRHQGVKPIH